MVVPSKTDEVTFGLAWPICGSESISEVKYVIRSLETGNERSAHIQHMIRFDPEKAPLPVDLDEQDDFAQDDPMKELTRGRFCVFAWKNKLRSRRMKTEKIPLHIAEVLGEYDQLSQTRDFRFYVDLGSNNNISTFDRQKVRGMCYRHICDFKLRKRCMPGST